MARLQPAHLITVLDTPAFLTEYKTRTLLAQRPELGDGGGFRPVVDLLVEQVEIADVILLNKLDCTTPSASEQVAALVSALNPLARILNSTMGQVPPTQLFSSQHPPLMACLNTEGQHRGAVLACQQPTPSCPHHAHPPTHLDASSQPCPPSMDTATAPPTEPCTCCAAAPPAPRGATSASARFGIESFVYERRRPFHPQRLRALVQEWMPRSGVGGKGGGGGARVESLRTVLRSKGFVWLSSAHGMAYYWSHAGAHFALEEEGEWWASVPAADWPQDPSQRETLLKDFAAPTEQGSFGDRRQELVFIGVGMRQTAIEQLLDQALVHEEEFKEYAKLAQAVGAPRLPWLKEPVS